MKRKAVIFYVIVCLCVAGPLMAQNLVLNGEFDADTNNWNPVPSSTITWVSDDGGPLSGNGSMMNSNSFNNGASFPAISNKFAVIPNYWYQSGVSFKVPADSSVPWVFYWFFWYDDMDNQIGISDQVSINSEILYDVWEQLDGLIQAPELATKGELRIYFTTGSTGETAVPYGLWDDVYVFEDSIFINGFD